MVRETDKESIWLIEAIASISTGLTMVIFLYAYLSGLASGGEGIVLKIQGVYGLILTCLGSLFLGVFGGIPLGMYLQSRRKAET